ncbi:MAG TPA: elongation factor G [Candidatus Omnitrophota bacterium]|nr:elongation factor G [Candidatus Omnitrophota bacterium]
MEAKLKRNLTLVGHAQSGKTTLAESILFFCKATTRKGDVMQGSTVSDYNEDEQDRKISINASFLKADHKGHQIQMIDTPGYMDFVGETVAALRATDAAILVVDAVNGVEVGTEDVWDRLNEMGLPRIIFINKIDKGEAKSDTVIAAIQEQLSNKAVKVDLESSDFIEAIAESDDKLLEKYLETGALSPEDIKRVLRQAVVQAKIFPIICGSALNDTGVEALLDAVVAYLPSPLERPALKAKMADSEEEKELVPEEEGTFSGFVFKSLFDPHLGQLSLMRVVSGTLLANTDYYNSNRKSKEHISTISLLQGKEQIKIPQANCGDIVALPKLKNSHVSDSLSSSNAHVVFHPITFPAPSLSASIKPKTRADEEKISTCLTRMCEEDHTLQVERDTETKEMLISGMGDLHLKIILDRMKSRYNLEVDLGTPKIRYRETITKTARYRYKYKKQSGGRGQYGDVDLEVAPLPRDGEEYEFVNKIFGGAIPKNYIPSVEKGVKQTIEEGALSKSPIINIQVSLMDGSFHAVDSSDMAFQIAGAMALKEAVKQAGPILLEPIMEVTIVIPSDFIGQISGDISSRRGRILGEEPKGKHEAIIAHIPQSEMFKYATDLRSMTGGRGTYAMTFSHYEQAPAKITDRVVEERNKQDEKE